MCKLFWVPPVVSLGFILWGPRLVSYVGCQIRWCISRHLIERQQEVEEPDDLERQLDEHKHFLQNVVAKSQPVQQVSMLESVFVEKRDILRYAKKE